MTDLKTLKQLIKLMVDNDLTELDLEGEAEKVKLKRGKGESPQVQYVAANPAGAAPAAAPAAAATPAAPSAPNATPAAEQTGPTIDSPMVGTYYSAPSPDAKAFVSAGDRVDADTVVCIIEAMKVFNEIKAETSGVVKKVLVENGQAVEFGQPLFEIQP